MSRRFPEGVTSELRRELCGAASDAWVIGEDLKALMQPAQIGPRLLEPELQDRLS